MFDQYRQTSMSPNAFCGKNMENYQRKLLPRAQSLLDDELIRDIGARQKSDALRTVIAEIATRWPQFLRLVGSVSVMPRCFSCESNFVVLTSTNRLAVYRAEKFHPIQVTSTLDTEETYRMDCLTLNLALILALPSTHPTEVGPFRPTNVASCRGGFIEMIRCESTISVTSLAS